MLYNNNNNNNNNNNCTACFITIRAAVFLLDINVWIIFSTASVVKYFSIIIIIILIIITTTILIPTTTTTTIIIISDLSLKKEHQKLMESTNLELCTLAVN